MISWTSRNNANPVVANLSLISRDRLVLPLELHKQRYFNIMINNKNDIGNGQGLYELLLIIYEMSGCSFSQLAFIQETTVATQHSHTTHMHSLWLRHPSWDYWRYECSHHKHTTRATAHLCTRWRQHVSSESADGNSASGTSVGKRPQQRRRFYDDHCRSSQWLGCPSESCLAHALASCQNLPFWIRWPAFPGGCPNICDYIEDRPCRTKTLLHLQDVVWDLDSAAAVCVHADSVADPLSPIYNDALYGHYLKDGQTGTTKCEGWDLQQRCLTKQGRHVVVMVVCVVVPFCAVWVFVVPCVLLAVLVALLVAAWVADATPRFLRNHGHALCHNWTYTCSSIWNENSHRHECPPGKHRSVCKLDACSANGDAKPITAWARNSYYVLCVAAISTKLLNGNMKREAHY